MLLFEFYSFCCQVPLLHYFCQIVTLFAFVAADQLENVNLSINIIYLSCALSSQKKQHTLMHTVEGAKYIHKSALC